MRTTLHSSVGIIAAFAVVLGRLSLPLAASAAEPDAVQFDRDIRPILSDVCYQCHGPDAKKRKGELRLDVEDDVFTDRDGNVPVVPGNLDKSELYQRIVSQDDDLRMPPPTADKKLAPQQIELIRRWIEQGAKWQKHWSFITPVAPPLPNVSRPEWVRNPIDAFVLARLDREGLIPSAEADKSTLIRRVTLDLTGLPPTPAEVDAFLADDSADAYHKLVDRLLMSDRYGERMASPWLDAARYADTNGYQSDGERFMWRWRDWVIEAFNDNMPYDQFTIEQLAGDLLPGATLEQRIATGFNRNHRGNGEGGIIPEEYAVEYVVDRVETTSTVWLGLTMGCSRCHEHKYDPIAQEDFYRFFAFFNNVPENGRAIKQGNSPPMMKAPTREQQRELAELEQRIADAESEFTALEPRLAAAQLEWERTQSSAQPIEWTVSDGLIQRLTLDGPGSESSGQLQPAVSATGPAAYAPGKVGGALICDGQRFVSLADLGQFGYFDPFSLAGWIFPQGEAGGVVLSRMLDDEHAEGYYVQLESNRLQVNLVKRWLDDSIRVETVDSLEPGSWHHISVTYDGSRVASGIKVYVDGRLAELKVHLDALNQDFVSEEPFRVGAGGGSENRFHGLVDDVRVYIHVLTPAEAVIVATTDRIDEIAARPAEQRSPGQSAKLAAWFLEQRAPDAIRNAWRTLHELRIRRAALIDAFSTVMVMEEMSPPRQTHVLTRGQYDKPAAEVTPGVPGCLTPMPTNAPMNRLGLARWLVDPANPLTARVAVNRFWQMHFGAGLVKTAEDFGSQGQRPTHPELLDWLATDFVRTGWNVKEMQRTIVTSATYRQQSKVSPELLKKDPENRLLARGPRLRLSAEMIRDQALFVSGLFVEKIGGPSVKPYQPAGLWEEVANITYTQDSGEALYRRSMYTFWKRTAAPPTMMTFDASPREMCTVKDARTNTPLQALALLNDVTFVEAARALAERAMVEASPGPEERITRAFRLSTARKPLPAELTILTQGFRAHVERYQQDHEAAEKLIHTGESKPNTNLDATELAAYTAIAGLILNLDEVVTKE
ncbi:MAG: DUF1553 domain-containing protein [Planctomycetaceae bacterium]